MAEDTSTPTEKKQTETPSRLPAAIDYREELKPAARWKTILTKVGAGVGMVFAAGTVAVGVISLVSPRSVISGYMKGAGHLPAPEEIEEAMGQIGSRIRTSGAATAIVGAIFGLWSTADYNTASGATRARNFVELQERLNGRESSQARG